MNNLKFVKERNIVSIHPLLKGWSKDKKYILGDMKNQKYLLRVSDASLHDKRKKQFELLQSLELLDIYCSRPIEFGVLNDGNVYMILSYLEGIDGIEAVSAMSDKEAYKLGIKAGKILQKFHSIPIPIQDKSWWDRYQEKMPRKIDALINCEFKIPMQDNIVSYYKLNSHLMKKDHNCFHMVTII